MCPSISKSGFLKKLVLLCGHFEPIRLPNSQLPSPPFWESTYFLVFHKAGQLIKDSDTWRPAPTIQGVLEAVLGRIIGVQGQRTVVVGASR